MRCTGRRKLSSVDTRRGQSCCCMLLTVHIARDDPNWTPLESIGPLGWTAAIRGPFSVQRWGAFCVHLQGVIVPTPHGTLGRVDKMDPPWDTDVSFSSSVGSEGKPNIICMFFGFDSLKGSLLRSMQSTACLSSNDHFLAVKNSRPVSFAPCKGG